MSEQNSVLVLGEETFPWHSLEDRVDAFHDILSPLGAIHLSTDRDELTRLDRRDVVVDYLSNSTLTTAQLDGLRTFIETGGGYVGLHCAADLTSISYEDGEVKSRPEPHPEFRDLLGGHFLTHPEQTEFTVTIERTHSITEGVDDFTIFDEPYQVEWDDDVTILARMNHPDLEDYPILWVKPFGDGRVCYLSLGHTDEAFATDSFRTLLRNAVRWTNGDT